MEPDTWRPLLQQYAKYVGQVHEGEIELEVRLGQIVRREHPSAKPQSSSASKSEASSSLGAVSHDKFDTPASGSGSGSGVEVGFNSGVRESHFRLMLDLMHRHFAAERARDPTTTMKVEEAKYEDTRFPGRLRSRRALNSGMPESIVRKHIRREEDFQVLQRQYDCRVSVSFEQSTALTVGQAPISQHVQERTSFILPSDLVRIDFTRVRDRTQSDSAECSFEVEIELLPKKADPSQYFCSILKWISHLLHPDEFCEVRLSQYPLLFVSSVPSSEEKKSGEPKCSLRLATTLLLIPISRTIWNPSQSQLQAQSHSQTFPSSSRALPLSSPATATTAAAAAVAASASATAVAEFKGENSAGFAGNRTTPTRVAPRSK